jgi:predicted ATP-dependent endonuclease of OLD family
MILVSAKVGPFRSMNTAQIVEVDPSVTVFVGMNEAGKTVFLKALHKSADALTDEKFEPVEDYPRKDLSAYLKQHTATPADATVLTYELDNKEIETLNSTCRTQILPGFQISITHRYNNNIQIACSVDEAPSIASFAEALSSDASDAIKSAKSIRSIPELLQGIGLTAGDEEALAKLKTRIEASAWQNVVQFEVWTHLKSEVPKFLYFSDYDLLPGKMNLADLEQRVEQSKTDPKQLKPTHRSVLALLRMADVSFKDLATPGGYEELKAKIEAVSISLTDQIMEFWKQNEDLEVEVDIKADTTDEAPYNNGPNLYLRIKNRKHRGVSTPFDQRSRGFIWFFSFLVWFDSVQHQLDPSGKNAGKKLILLLDEPGLALHALAQADFLRYIDRLAEEHQVLYSTHSPFMVHSDRLHQVRLVEDQPKLGTVISANLTGSDPRTIFPLQAALGWNIAQNLFISERNLLVEGPSELIYLQHMSNYLESEGSIGLRDDVTIVPTGGLDNVATFVSLLGASGLKLAILHDYRGSPEQKLTHLVREKLLAEKSLFNVSQFRDTAKFGVSGIPSDIEDLFAVDSYLDYFNATFEKQLAGTVVKEADLPAGDRIVFRLEQYIKEKGITIRPSGGFNHYAVAARFASTPPTSVDAETTARFKALFAAINGVF